jgi:uncharacterized protein (TIRG00374 family)
MDEVTLGFDGAAAAPRKLAMRRIAPILGYALAFAGLIWVLSDFRLGHLRGMLSQLDWRWLALALACDVGSYICQGARWRLLLKPVAELSLWRATQAIYAGLFTNEILPMRIGELVRAYLITRWTSVRFLAVLPSMVVERIFDAIWLALGVGLTALFVALPETLLRAAALLGGIVILAAGVLLYFSTRSPGPGQRSNVSRSSFSSLLERASQSLRGMARRKEFYWSLFVSLLLLIHQALAFWFVMLGCGFRLGFWVGSAVFLIVHLGTAIPNAPANVGSYQLFTVIGLTIFGVDKEAAASFSLVVFTLLTLPLLIVGFAAFSASGVSLWRIRREVQQLEQ